MKEKDKQPAISYYSKQKFSCPFCGARFEREEMLSGGGRMIAGVLTDELRRTFEPSAKYGRVYPLIYSIAACPDCNAAVYWSDLEVIADEKVKKAVHDTREQRKESVAAVFPHYSFRRNRTLLDGAAAYYLALLCYGYFPPSFSPTVKRAQICLRLAWLCGDLENECPNHNFSYMQQVFYRKALFFYQDALMLELSHEEPITGMSNYGPDIDKNYGYDGVIYLNGLLEYKYGQREDIQFRLKKLDEHKRAIARIFGLGKSSKNKPGPLLEHSRTLYDNLTEELKDARMPEFDDADGEFDASAESAAEI
ncbi:MAG: DUF2225 domain-containing protein [Bacteroides sp.]|nr:DUF2225 domain-containing protein [Prevotella sp.]MCM1407343.1 DUF2225 domain-containing protein [Treponema brennaborense]MCM1469833.1 DUF2225 domain-containing protein [Bacteroides sp.]